MSDEQTVCGVCEHAPHGDDLCPEEVVVHHVHRLCGCLGENAVEEEEHKSYAQRRAEDWKEAMRREDEVSFDPPGVEGQVFFEVVVRYRWSEIASTEGLLEAIDMVKDDTLGTAVDAYLEPRYETDTTEVLSFTHVVKYGEDETTDDNKG